MKMSKMEQKGYNNNFFGQSDFDGVPEFVRSPIHAKELCNHTKFNVSNAMEISHFQKKYSFHKVDPQNPKL